MNRLTKKELFTNLLNVVKVEEFKFEIENTQDEPFEKEPKDALISLIKKEISSLSRTKKVSNKKDDLNNTLKAEIVEYLSTVKQARVSDITLGITTEVSSSKVAYICRLLVDDGDIAKEVTKGISYYKVVSIDEETDAEETDAEDTDEEDTDEEETDEEEESEVE